MTDLSSIKLENNSRVAIIGGGPAGSFFGYFLLEMTKRAGKTVSVNIFEPHDFDKPGPAGCNNCGGIISEWLVQALAADGINLPADVVARGIDSYAIHMDVGDAQIETPLHEKRIGAIHRGAGPRGIKDIRLRGFDSFILEQVKLKGAQVVRGRVDSVKIHEGRPMIKIRGGDFQEYDLLTVAMGKNNAALKMFQNLGIGYVPPKVNKTYIAEIFLGSETVAQCLGTSMHVFLLDMPHVEFAAIIPKGDYATMCMLGENIDRDTINAFVNSEHVKQCMPQGWTMPTDLCHCSPFINIAGAIHPFADRIVFIGDCAVTRLYKDGIGAAYRAAKMAATTAVFEGIGERDFKKQYAPLLRKISNDNGFGRLIFMATHVIKKIPLLRRGVIRMVMWEQNTKKNLQGMSTVLWDTFTGSAPYREVFLRILPPRFWMRFIYDILAGIFSFKSERIYTTTQERNFDLGKMYHDGEIIVKQGEPGNTMFVIQTGQVRVVNEMDGSENLLGILKAGEFFGEMALVEHNRRSATVYAIGETRVLTIDKRTFKLRVSEDPSLSYRILQKMSHRIRTTNNELVKTQNQNFLGNSNNVSAFENKSPKTYQAGEILIREGDPGDCAFVIQSGEVQILKEKDGEVTKLATRKAGDIIGEMAIFEDENRSATVQALGEVNVLRIDRAMFLEQLHKDPGLAFRIMVNLSSSLRDVNSRLVEANKYDSTV